MQMFGQTFEGNAIMMVKWISYQNVTFFVQAYPCCYPDAKFLNVGMHMVVKPNSTTLPPTTCNSPHAPTLFVLTVGTNSNYVKLPTHWPNMGIVPSFVYKFSQQWLRIVNNS